MKRLGMAALGLLLALSFTTVSHAALADMYTSTSNGGSLVDTFTMSQTPWLYVGFPTSGWRITSFWFESPSTTPYYNIELTTSDSQWYDFGSLIFTNPNNNTQYNWNQIKALGTWNVGATYGDAIAPTGYGHYNATFKVVPEPISCALFVLGGAALAVSRRKKA